MILDKNIELIDLGVHIVSENILVVSDFHLGYEEHLNKHGVMMPRHQFAMTMERLEKLFTHVHPSIIIVNGDMKHEFGSISETEWRYTLRLIDFLASQCKQLLLLQGNHDTIVSPIVRKRNIAFMESFMAQDILIIHGDKIVPAAHYAGVKTIIIGHEHPAISLSDGVRQEKYKCFLMGTWKRKRIIVMPSFNVLIEGTDVLQEKMLSHFLQGNLSLWKAIAVSDTLYDFGTLKHLK